VIDTFSYEESLLFCQVTDGGTLRNHLAISKLFVTKSLLTNELWSLMGYSWVTQGRRKSFHSPPSLDSWDHRHTSKTIKICGMHCESYSSPLSFYRQGTLIHFPGGGIRSHTCELHLVLILPHQIFFLIFFQFLISPEHKWTSETSVTMLHERA
jgi:hypothetical protein